MTEKKNLTLRYCFHQLVYWSAIAGIVSFAATYLLSKGFSEASVGWILFGAYLGSFALQPIAASFADKARKNIIPQLMSMLGFLSLICFSVVWLADPPLPVFAVLYLAGILFLDMQVPLLNSLNVYYSMRSWKLNYGLARGLGGAGFAVASLLLGFIAKEVGTNWIIISSILLIAVFEVICLTYPKDDSNAEENNVTAEQRPSSLVEFVRKYKWYCLSLFGILFTALFHVMTENFLISILGRLGGDSSNVGIALFVATAIELPAMTVFVKFYDRFGARKILMVAAFSFLLKAVLLLIAKSITAVYFIQLLQCVTYVLISMVQMYYARECTENCDMIKGQSFITAFFTLGCAFGNLIGGNIIASHGVLALLKTGVAVTAAGLVILLLTVKKALNVGK